MDNVEKRDKRREGVWVYYTNDEGKPRWKCSECGKIIRHGVDEKLFCSRCGAALRREC